MRTRFAASIVAMVVSVLVVAPAALSMGTIVHVGPGDGVLVGLSDDGRYVAVRGASSVQRYDLVAGGSVSVPLPQITTMSGDGKTFWWPDGYVVRRASLTGASVIVVPRSPEYWMWEKVSTNATGTVVGLVGFNGAYAATSAFVWEVATKKLTRLSPSETRIADWVTVSASGRYVSYYSQIEPVGSTRGGCIYVRDLSTGITSVVSLNTAGKRSTTGYYRHPVISGDGRKVAFLSDATDLVAGATTRVWRLYLRNLDTRTTTLLTANLTAPSSYWPDLAIDGSGSRVVFYRLAPISTGGNSLQAFVLDVATRAEFRLATGLGGVNPNGPTGAADLAATGRVAFESHASNLVSSHLTGVFTRTL